MFYNHIYNLEFKGLDQQGTDLYYKVKFEKREDAALTPPVIDLIPAQDGPFVLNYKSTEDNIFSPIRSSFADIKCFIPLDSEVQPSDFFFETDEYTWRITLYETDGTTDSIKWRGFLLPDVIQYEWQEQYYLQLTATDNLGTLKDIKYSREDYYSLYEDTSVYNGISVKDFICRLLKKTGSDLNVAIFSQLKIGTTLYNVANLKLSDYSGMDWKSFTPKDCYFLLTNLMRSLGCVLYQSNLNATWYVISINDVAVNDLVTDGTFSIDGTIIGQPYEYWTIVGSVINSSTGGLNGGQCPKIFGDNTSYVYQPLSFNAAEYLIGFWAKNDGAVTPRAVIRFEIDGMEVFNQVSTDEWAYYEFLYTSGGAGIFNITFFNDNPDDNGYLLIDNVSVKQQYQNGLKYNIDGTYINTYTFDFYSTIGNSGNVIWSDVNQVVTLNKRLTGVQYVYPNFERNLVDNFGFWKDYSSTTQIPTNWQKQGTFGFFQKPDAENTPFDAKTLNVYEKQSISSALNLTNYLYTTMMLSNYATDIPPRLAIKVECAVKFTTNHNDNDYINIAFVKSSAGTPGSAGGTRYLDYKGDWYPQTTSTLFNKDTRIPIFVSDKDNWVNFKCLSKTDSIFNFGTLIIRPQINNNTNDTFVEFDNFKVSIIPQGWENVISNMYVSTNLPNTALTTKTFSNIYKVEGLQYQGGRIGTYQSQIIEDFIGFVGGSGTIVTSDRWLRIWEVYDSASFRKRGRTLNNCTTSSILSFYQATWQKFTGNVYGKNITFGQVFNIALAQGLHFMHEASFDYVSNKTNITTHQSQTDKLETNFRSWAVDVHDNNAGQGEAGSTTSKIQDVETLITPIGG